MQSFVALQQQYSQRVDRAIESALSELPFTNHPLVQAMRYGALLGGKRLRPFLVYATGKMFGLNDDSLDAPAAAIECIHAYSLIHDDLPAMDNDDLRRGLPTCHIKFGEANAILAGDALQTLAFSILSDTTRIPAGADNIALPDRLAMISELARASGAQGMCAGQALDLEAEGKHIDLAQLEQIHSHKTGALINASVRLGALAAGNNGRKALPILDRYSKAIGLAFQVQDDILDVIGDTSKIGKRQGSDQQHQKSTYPALLGIKQAQEKATMLYQEAVNALNELSQLGYDTCQLQLLANFIVERDN